MTPEPVTISLEFTPNPNTLKFVINRTLLERGASNFTSLEKAVVSPLAERLFKVPGVAGVLIGTNFVTITKAPEGEWDIVAEEVPKAIESHVKDGTAIFVEGWSPEQVRASNEQESEVERKIREVLDNEIRPAVAMDGGDITFGRYEEGTVYLHLQGSCSSCPSSVATLKMGVEARLREVVPEVKEVVQV